MNVVESMIADISASSGTARNRFLACENRPLLIGDWSEAVFVHYAVRPEALQPHVPLELDLWEGYAFVSLVAFTMRRLRPGWGGRLTGWMMRPFATQRFLNLRAYVRNGEEAGIYFMTEWNSHRPCVWLAPHVYGLPYRHGSISYRHSDGMKRGCGRVYSEGAGFQFEYARDPEPLRACTPGSLDEFLIERYLAFASAGGHLRCFRVWHEPWLQATLRHFQADEALLKETLAWWGKVKPVSTNVSPGVTSVWMGRPQAAQLEFKRDRATDLRLSPRSTPDGHR